MIQCQNSALHNARRHFDSNSKLNTRVIKKIIRFIANKTKLTVLYNIHTKGLQIIFQQKFKLPLLFNSIIVCLLS